MPRLNAINPPNAPIVPGYRLTPEWYRYFVTITKSSSVASDGEVATPPGSGLTGGGVVADGVTLAIDVNGVTNAMLRQGAATSVIGRMANSAGNVADIPAATNRTALQRQGNMLSFSGQYFGSALAMNCREIDADTSIGALDYAIIVDATGAAVDLTLPPLAQNLGRVLIFKKADASANAVTASGDANIDGAATLSTTTQYEAFTLIAGETEWWVV